MEEEVIGLYPAIRFAALGAKVLITGRTEQPLRDLSDAHKSMRPRHLT